MKLVNKIDSPQSDNLSNCGLKSVSYYDLEILL